MPDMEEPEDTILGAMKLKLNATRLAKVEKLKKLQVLGGKYFDLPLLYSFGCRREVKYLIAHPRWDRVFGWRWDTYAPVVYEFIATLQLKKEMYHNKHSTSFTIFNKKHDLLASEYWKKITGGTVNYNPSNMSSKTFDNNAYKAVRHALAVTFTGRMSNMHNCTRFTALTCLSMEHGYQNIDQHRGVM
nr:hypothetical protein Itr_chr02CG09590 [Ipomoea trifida]